MIPTQHRLTSLAVIMSVGDLDEVGTKPFHRNDIDRCIASDPTRANAGNELLEPGLDRGFQRRGGVITPVAHGASLPSSQWSLMTVPSGRRQQCHRNVPNAYALCQMGLLRGRSDRAESTGRRQSRHVDSDASGTR